MTHEAPREEDADDASTVHGYGEGEGLVRCKACLRVKVGRVARHNPAY